jgi:hypothetical protein
LNRNRLTTTQATSGSGKCRQTLNIFTYLKVVGATGLEPATSKSQSFVNKELTGKVCLATVQKLPKNPDLQQIITVWPDLPEHIRAAIKALAQTHKQ